MINFRVVKYYEEPSVSAGELQAQDMLVVDLVTVRMKPSEMYLAIEQYHTCKAHEGK